jgi:hypothetical protein
MAPKIRLVVAFGSKTEVGGSCREVRFTRRNGSGQPGPSGPKSANFGLMRCNKSELLDHLVGTREYTVSDKADDSTYQPMIE